MDHIIRLKSAIKSSFSKNCSTVAVYLDISKVRLGMDTGPTIQNGRVGNHRAHTHLDKKLPYGPNYERKDRQPTLNSKGSGEWSPPGSSVKPDPI
ncbi:Pol-like protein [Daphnia magna]|uniref:Pol-like protein n=1 Tax=Daphnia magna TaxID=35525 RepID=A0A164J495_9CRUS|nr:Pol-like protein [Daphnia magna]